MASAGGLSYGQFLEIAVNLPDFVIVGAPKCGTTSLHAYLAQHPDVFVSTIKEPHFFGFDLKGISRVQGIEAYQALFSSAPAGALKGEASATYLFSQVAIRELMRVQPEARIIIMLRNPVEAVQSYHRQLLKGLLEDIEDFATAWRAQSDRAEGRRIPAASPEPSLLLYGPTYRYGEQLQRALDHVPAAQLHVILYEDFIGDSGATYRQALKFLGLADDRRASFPIHNPGADLRSRSFARLYLAPPSWLRRLWAPFRSMAHRARIYPPEILQALNLTRAPRRTLSPELAVELRTYFDDDIRATEILLGRSLDIWRS